MSQAPAHCLDSTLPRDARQLVNQVAAYLHPARAGVIHLPGRDGGAVEIGPAPDR